jgi:hypothetical protein
MPTRFVAFASFLFGAEVVASWWVWGRAPTDTIRVWYSGFWSFEASRLHYWLPVVASLAALWIVVWYTLLRHRRAITWWLFSAMVAVGLEVATSMLYWRSPRSSNLRGLYQSIWAWHRVPQASDMGWPSFRVYLWDHLVPWASALFLGMILWVLFEQKVRNATPIALPGTRNG